MKVLIVDDEEYVRIALTEMLKLHCPEIDHINVADSISEGRKAIETMMPDLVFLDICLSDGKGFDLLKGLVDLPFKIIFITAYEEYAIKAFKFSAIDYLLKPIDVDELISAVNKAGKTIENENTKILTEAFLRNQESSQKKIALKTTEAIHLIDVKDIVRCNSDGNYTNFIIDNNKSLMVSKTLKEFEELLVPYGFVRIHQSHLINVNFIEKYDKRSGGFIVLKDGAEVPVSTRKREELLKIFDAL